MEKEINLNGKTYVLKEYIEEQKKEDTSEKDENGNINCNGCQDVYNSTSCNNSTWCNNSTSCDNSTRCNNSTSCDNSTRCDNSTGCDNSTSCDNSTGCNNSAYLIYCCDLVLEKFMIFNKQLKDKNEFEEIRNKITLQLGYYKHPKQLSKEDKQWLQDNIKQYDGTVLNKIIEDSILPDKPK